MSEVNAVNMARWIVALRSGKYTQGRTRLRQDHAFCCLGVACDVSGLGVWTGDETYLTPGDSYGGFYVMPNEVVRWFGVERGNPNLNGAMSCGGANDDLSWSFNQIADALESRYLPNTTAEKVLEEK